MWCILHSGLEIQCFCSCFCDNFMYSKHYHGNRGTQRHFQKHRQHYERSREQTSDQVRPTYTEQIQLDKPEQAKGVRATYTTDPVEGEAWLRNNVIDVNEVALGFDMEWKPQFVKKKLGGKENPTAVLQLSTENSCLVLHISHVKSLPKHLVEVLSDKDILKVGCGIRSDVSKLLKDTGLHCKGAVDLVQLASKMGCTKEQGLGLKALSRNLLGMELEKPKSVQLSNWERFPLGRNQIHYAALDAWVGIKLYLYMKENLGSDEVDVQPSVQPEAVLPSLLDEKVCCHVCGKKCQGESALQDHLANAGHAACINCGMMFVQHVTKKHLRKCTGTIAHGQTSG